AKPLKRRKLEVQGEPKQEPKAQGDFAAQIDAAIARQKAKAEARAKPEFFISPELQPSVEPQAAKVQEEKEEAEPEGGALVPVAVPEVVAEPLLLDPAVPFDNAGKLIEAYYWHAGERVRILAHHQKEFWKWNGTHWAVIDDDTFRADVWKQLH